ncbi:hypothetical protein M5K25_013637 [Dendrobium thyrsiflorum]|uniref:Uncharacterized protein n=1 Tax=Dendrobium thyrsiflorum TaxID=117978 RepID=A0ABD0UUA4_DENTH
MENIAGEGRSERTVDGERSEVIGDLLMDHQIASTWETNIFKLDELYFDRKHLKISSNSYKFLWDTKIRAPASARLCFFTDGSFNGFSFGADEVVDKALPRDFALILRGLYDLSSGFL